METVFFGDNTQRTLNPQGDTKGQNDTEMFGCIQEWHCEKNLSRVSQHNNDILGVKWKPISLSDLWDIFPETS